MAEEEKKADKRHWWEHDRVQGLGIMLLGIGMLFTPITSPYAGSVIAAGVGWVTAGAKNAAIKNMK